jgi:hypothetical protein
MGSDQRPGREKLKELAVTRMDGCNRFGGGRNEKHAERKREDLSISVGSPFEQGKFRDTSTYASKCSKIRRLLNQPECQEVRDGRNRGDVLLQKIAEFLLTVPTKRSQQDHHRFKRAQCYCKK